MYEWEQQIQIIVDEIDECIKRHDEDALTLQILSRKLGYSEFHTTRKFKEVSGMSLREYLRHRKLTFALKEVRDSERGLLEIALDYGFSSHEAFTRTFKKMYGVTPSEYRKKPIPLVLRTKIAPFDRYFLGIGEIGMIKSDNDIKIYFVTIPAHKFLHIKHYDSNGYWDFWEKQKEIPGHDCETICGLLDSIKGKLDYEGDIPSQMLLMDVPEAEYVVFEHGPFDYEQENCSIEEKMEKAISSFDFANKGYCFDTSPGRIAYLYHDPARFWKEIRPVTSRKR